MKSNTDVAASTADREISSTRVFDAPREVVFDAFTRPEILSKWWGPRGFSTTTHSMDFRPGGTWNYTMHGPDGRDYKNQVRYIEIVRPERLVYRHGGGEEHADVSFLSTVTLVDRGGKTELTMRGVFETAEERNRVAEKYGAVEGMHQTLERLGELLAK